MSLIVVSMINSHAFIFLFMIVTFFVRFFVDVFGFIVFIAFIYFLGWLVLRFISM